MAAKITVDIEAKVKGYQEAIEQMKAAFAKLDPGTTMAKSIKAGIQSAEAELKSLSRNMFPTASSEGQIDAIINKVNHLGDSIIATADKMKGLGINDLDLSAMDPQIQQLISNLDQLQGKFTETISQGMKETINNSQELSQAFKDLGIELNNNSTTDSILDAVIAKSEEAKQKVTEMEQAFSKAEKKYNTEIGNLTALTNNPLFTNKDQMDKDLQNIASDYTNAINKLKPQLEQGLKSLDIKGGEKKREELLNNFLGGLTPENLRARLMELKNSVQAAAKETLTASEIYKSLFGDTLGRGGNASAIEKALLANIFPSDSVFNDIKTNFLQKLSEISKYLTDAQIGNVQGLLSKGQIDTALEKTLQYLQSAYQTLQGKVVKASQAVYDAIEGKDTARANLETAKTSSSQADVLYNKLQNQINDLIQRNSDQQRQIEQLRREIDARKKGALEQVKRSGTGAAERAGEQMFPTAQVKMYKTELEQATAAEQMIGKVQGVVQRWFSIYAAVRMVGQAVRSIISTIKELDATITEIAIVTNMTQEELWGQMDKYTDTARKYATSISGVYKVSQLYYQQGLQQADVMALTEQTLKMARVSGLDYATATDYMTNAVRSFKMEMQDAQNVVDVYSAIAASSATSVTELASAMSKTASSAQAVGSSFQNTTAMMAVMIEATRESAENIGSAMKSIISRYGEMTSDPSKLVDSEGEEMSINRVDKALQTVGISIHDATGQFRDFDEVIMELAEKWDTIDKNTQRYIATIMAGNRQQSRFLALVSSYDRLKELSQTAADSEDASQLQFLKTLDSVDAKTQQLQTSLQSLYTDTGLEKIYKGLLDYANEFTKTLTNMPKLFDKPIPAILKIGTTFASLATTVSTVFGLIKNVIQANIQAIQKRETAAAAGSAEERMAAEDAVTDNFVANSEARKTVFEQELLYYKSLMSGNNGNLGLPRANTDAIPAEGTVGPAPTLFGRLFNNKNKKNKINGGITAKSAGLALGMNIAGLALTGISSGMQLKRDGSQYVKGGLGIAGQTLSMAGMGTMISPGIGTAIGATAGAIMGLIENWNVLTETVEERLNRLKEAAEEANNNKLKSKAELKTLTEYKQKYDELNKSQYESEEKKKEFIDLQNEIAATYPELIASMDAEGNYVIDMANAYEKLAEAKAKTYKKDFISNISAELEGLGNIDYMLQKYYGTKPLHNAGGIGGSSYFSFSNKGDLETVSKKYQEYFKSSERNITPELNLSWVSNTKSHTYREIFGQDTVAGDSIFTPASISEQQTQFYDKLIQSMADYASQGLSRFEAAQKTIEKFKDDPVAKQISNFEEYLYKFNTGLYNYFQVLSEGLKDQDDLIQKFYKRNNQEWLSMLSQTTGIEVTNLQFDVMSKQANQQWENFKLTRSAWTHQLGDTFINDEGKTDKWDWNDVYNQFLTEIINPEWFKTQTKLLISLQDKKANEFYKTIGQLTREQVKENPLSNKFPEILELYDEKFAEILGDGTEKNLGLYQEAINNMDFVSPDTKNTLSKFKDLFGPEFLMGILDNYRTILDNENLTDDQKTKQINALSAIYTQIGTIPDPLKRATAISKIQSADLTSLIGIYTLIDSLQNESIELDESGIKQALLNFGNTLSINIETELQSFSKKITENMSDFDKAISSATKGMDFKTATEMAQKLDKRLTDFTFRDGKYYFDNLELINQSYLDINKEYTDALQAKITAQNEALKNHFLIIDDENFEEDIKNNHTEFLESVGINAEVIINKHNQFMQLSKEKREQGFINWLIAENQAEADAIIAASEQNIEYSINSGYLTSGNISKFLKSTKAIKDPINYIDQVDSSLEDFDSRLIAAAEIMQREEQKLTSWIVSGYVDELPEELQQYASLIYNTFHSVGSTVANSIISGLEGGETNILVTGINKQALQEAKDAGWIKGEVIENKLVEIDIDTIKSLEEGNLSFQNWLLDSYTNEADRFKALKSYHKIKYPDISSNLSNIITTGGEISYNAMIDYLESIGLTADEAANALQDYGLEIAKDGELKISDLPKYITQLKNDAEKFKDNLEKYNETQAQLYEAEHYQVLQRKQAIETVLKSPTSITAKQRGDFATALGTEFEQVAQYFSEDGMGGFKLDVDALKTAIENGTISVSAKTQAYFNELFAQIADGYLSAISTASSLVSKGTTKQADMENFVKEYNELFETQKNAGDLFNYSEILESWTLSPEVLKEYVAKQAEKLKESGFLKPGDVDKWIKTQTSQALAGNVNISEFLSSDNTDETGKAYKKLTESMREYYKSLSGTANKTDEEINSVIAKEINNLKSGGIDAVKEVEVWASRSGREATSQEIEEAFNFAINELNDAMGHLTDLTVGQITTGKLREYLQAAGKVDDNGVVTSVDGMVSVYRSIYQDMKHTAGSTTAGLNAAYAKVKTAEEQDDIDAIAAMGDAMGMTYDTLGSLLAKTNTDLEQWLSDNKDLYQNIGAGKIRITNFTAFAKQQGWESGSEEYLSAFNAYNDSLVALNRQTEKNILEEVQNVLSAKGGDQINLTYLSSKLGEVAELVLSGTLQQYGASLTDGILTIREGANLVAITQEIISTATEAADLLPEEIADLKDAISEALQSFTDAINNGISGKLTERGKLDLQTMAKNYLGIDASQLTFTQTVDGLKLSQQSAILLYQELKKIDRLQASLVFDDLNKSLQDNNEHYKNVSDIMNRIKYLQDEIAKADGTVSNARRQEYEAELAVAKEILAVRSTSEDSSFNFMSNKIPGGQNNPLNYYSSWQKAIKTIEDGVKVKGKKNKTQYAKGFIDYQDFYNIATEMNNLAKISGQQFKLAGVTLDGSMEAASELIQKGAASLQAVDTGELKVNLKSVGLDILGGANSLSEGVDAGIHAMAQSQIDMLDGLISLLETITAMEDLGDVAGEDMEIELPDIQVQDKNTGEWSFTSAFDKWRKAKLAEIKEGKTGFAKAAKEVKIADKSLADIIAQEAGEWTEDQAKILNSLWKAAKNGDWDVDNVAESMKKILADAGLGDDANLTIDVGKTHYIVQGGAVVQSINFESDGAKKSLDKLTKNGGKFAGDVEKAKKYITNQVDAFNKGHDSKVKVDYNLVAEVTGQLHKDKKGEYVVFNGKKYRGKNIEGALRARRLVKEFGAKFKDIKIDDQTASSTVTYTGDQKIKFTISIGANDKASWSAKYNGDTYFGSSREAVLKKIFNANKTKGAKTIKYGDEELTFDQWVYAAFKIRLNDASYKFVNKNGQEVDPTKNKVLNQKIKDFLRQTDDDIRNAVTDNKNRTSTIKIGGYSLTVDTDSITVGNDKKNAGLIRQKLMESLGLDTLLVESITQGIVGALPSISDAIKKLGENKETASNVKTLASALSSLFTSLTKLNGLNLNTLKTQLSTFLKDLNTLENGEGNTQFQFTQEVTAVITKFISGENADPNTLVNALSAIITSYTDADATTALTVAKAITGVITAYTDPNASITGLTKANNIEALVSAYTDADGNIDTTGLVTTFTAMVNAYKDATGGVDTSLLNTTFTAMADAYKDADGKINTDGLKTAITAFVNQYAKSPDGVTGEDTLSPMVDALVQAFAEAPDGADKSAIEALISNLVAKISEINPEAFKTWYEKNKEVEITAKIKMDSNLSEEEIKSRIEYLERMIEQEKALLTTDSGEADLQSYAKDSDRDISEVKEEARQELARMKAELEMLKKQLAEAQKKTEEPDTTTTTTVEDFVNESEGEAQQGGEDTALAFLQSFMETLEQNGGDLDATLEGVGVEKKDLIANINEALSDAKLPPLEPGVNLDDVINKIKSLQLPDKTINIYGYYAGERNTNEQEGASAKGNVALASGNAMASGTKTLMGELGPELVVSHGRYFVAGQNGAEFVDLDKDAIVFNHLQTESLLKNGKAGRGKAKTNERNAVGMATGNVNGGPALASASSALNALKQLRAMWQSLLDASVQDMASKAGSGGGGGGGGGKKDKGFMKEVERWYTLMQRIAQLEKDINYQEQLRNKIMSDRNGTGKQYWLSQKKSLNDLGQEISYQKELAISQQSYFDKRRAELNKQSGFSKLYTFDASGQLVYNDKAKLKNGKKGGLSFLSDLFATDTKTGAAKYTDEQKYKKLIDAGLVGSKAYDENGNLIKKPKKGAKKDEWNTYYTEVVKSFSSKMDADKEEMQKLHDSIDDANEKVLELEQQRNEILNEMRDKYLELEDQVFNAVKELKQRAIDELQDLRDATEKSNQRYLDGLNAALQSEQNMYQKNESRNELDKMRRQLAILQRSGGSASQIASLQNDIRSKEKDQYFDERQSQIDAIQKASDNQIKKMDQQIEIMQKTLDYQVKYGLLWGDVANIMKQSPKEIANFIKNNSSDYWGKSPEALNKANDELERLIDYVAASNQQRKLLESVKQVDEQWKGSATTVWDDKNKKWKIEYNGQGTEAALKKQYSNKVWDAAGAEAKKQYYATYNKTGDPKAAAKAARKVLDDEKKKQEPAKEPTKEPGKTDDKKGGKGENSGKKTTAQLGRYQNKDGKTTFIGWYTLKVGQKTPSAPTVKGYKCISTNSTVPSSGAVAGKTYKVTYTYSKTGAEHGWLVTGIDKNGKKIRQEFSLKKYKYDYSAAIAANNWIKKNQSKAKGTLSMSRYKRGGQVDYTGLAQVDGTPSRPEAFFNAEQTKILKNGLLGNSSRILASTLEEFNNIVEGMANGATYNTIDRGSSLVIENASVNMNVQSIANDYDARRAGEQALEQMMRIARKSGTKGVSRR